MAGLFASLKSRKKPPKNKSNLLEGIFIKKDHTLQYITKQYFGLSPLPVTVANEGL